MLMAMGLVGRRCQYPGTDRIDHKTQHRHDQCLVKRNRHRADQAPYTFGRHHHGEPEQQHGAAETRQAIDLADPKGKALVCGKAPGQYIGQHRNPQRGGMGRHVQAVSQQCH